MLEPMHEIGNIHTFEDKEFLASVSRISTAVMAVGIAVALVMFGILCPELSELTRLHGWGAMVAWVAALLAGSVVSLALHEGVHGLFFKLFAPQGARVSFGANWKLGMLYACAEGIVYSRRHYLVIILAPTVVVTALLVPVAVLSGWPFCCYVIAGAHLAGCVGDWKYAAAVLHDPAITHCEDTSWGVRFLSDAAEATEAGESEAEAATASAGPIDAPGAPATPDASDAPVQAAKTEPAAPVAFDESAPAGEGEAQ